MIKLLKYMSVVLAGSQIPYDDREAIIEMMIVYDIIRRLQESGIDCEIQIDCSRVGVSGIIKVYQNERRQYMNYNFESLPDLRVLVDRLEAESGK